MTGGLRQPGSPWQRHCRIWARLGGFWRAAAAGAATIAFGDGHTELWQWTDARTMPPIVVEGSIWNGQNGGSSPGNVDVSWMQDHATRPK